MVALASKQKALAALYAPEFRSDDVWQWPVRRNREKQHPLTVGDLDNCTVFEVCPCYSHHLFKLAGRSDRQILTKVVTSGTAHSARITAGVEGLQRVKS